ncbi:hypothetical protein TNCV_4386951 [Trichonephila clavipes]|nr:hypothetical protein TNCV_4386951 [Trichonephila clavipes]
MRKSGEFAGFKSALLRGLSIAFLSLIGTQTVRGSPQFEFRSTSRYPYRFALSLKGPHKGSLKNPVFRWRSFTTALSKIQSSLSGALAPLISSLSYHPSPNYPSVISCSFAASVGLGSLDLLFFCHPCRSQPISSLAQWAPMSRCILSINSEDEIDCILRTVINMTGRKLTFEESERSKIQIRKKYAVNDKKAIKMARNG